MLLSASSNPVLSQHATRCYRRAPHLQIKQHACRAQFRFGLPLETLASVSPPSSQAATLMCVCVCVTFESCCESPKHVSVRLHAEFIRPCRPSPSMTAGAGYSQIPP